MVLLSRIAVHLVFACYFFMGQSHTAYAGLVGAVLVN